VILGLLGPSTGEIVVDGVPLRILAHEAFRKSIGVVMQDDQLLSGSIADNICFFDESFELEHMVHCAELTGIHEETCRMPMAYNSLIGDMGTSLSGGQKQRVLLARTVRRRSLRRRAGWYCTTVNCMKRRTACWRRETARPQSEHLD
jgi:ATP-binding cassette subfamily B protein RaxB